MQFKINIFPKKSLRTQYLVLALFLIAGLLSLNIILQNQIDRMYLNIDEITQKRHLLSNYCLRIDGTLNRAISLQQNFLFTRSNLSREKTQAIWENELIVYVDSLTNLTNNLNEDKELLIKIQELRKNIGRLYGNLENLIKISPNNKIKIEILDRDIKSLQDKIHQELFQIASIEETEIQDVAFALKKQIRVMYYWSIVSMIVLLVVVSVFVFNSIRRIGKVSQYIYNKNMVLLDGNIPPQLSPSLYEMDILIDATNEIIERFRRLKSLAEDIKGGNLDTNIKVVDGKGEIGAAVTGMRDNLKHISIENWERNWVSEGLNKFTEILRNDTENSRGFYELIISKLVNYLDINQGGIFILNSGDESTPPLMELKATYAFKQEKYTHKSIGEGEGLVGRAWTEKDMIYINDIPEDYAYITSGLGGARPKSILIMPLMSNEQVFGILELASFTAMKTYQIDFVKKISENIAITISRVKISENNRLILEASKNLSSQMQSQEEEMRQNMEVLLNSQEKLEYEVMGMKAQLQAINETFAMMELDKEGNFIHVNDVIKRISGYTEREMLGKHYSLLLREKAESVGKSWQSVLNGQNIRGEFVRYNKSGEKFWMYEIIHPFYNSFGKLEKIFAISYEITRLKQQESLLKQKIED